jgi:MSHA biogenesis protein MshQ
MKDMKVFVLTVAMALLAGAAWSAELVGYWAFNENQGAVARNSAISEYNGKINGAKWVPGKIGSALEFNGAGDFVEVKDTAENSPFALTSMSISAWIKPSAYPSGDAPVWCAGIAGKGYNSESTYGIRLHCDGRLHFRAYGPFGESGKMASFDCRGEKDKEVSLNEWHHVAVTYDNVKVKLFLDGKLDSAYKENRLPGINKQSIFIGFTSPVSERYFKGIIDEVKIYKGALTDAEVEAEYKKGS